jgi:hypothetical protein
MVPTLPTDPNQWCVKCKDEKGVLPVFLLKTHQKIPPPIRATKKEVENNNNYQ